MYSIAKELAAALRNLLDQARQMSDMFPDEDNVIANAMRDAEESLQSYEAAIKLS